MKYLEHTLFKLFINRTIIELNHTIITYHLLLVNGANGEFLAFGPQFNSHVFASKVNLRMDFSSVFKRHILLIDRLCVQFAAKLFASIFIMVAGQT